MCDEGNRGTRGWGYRAKGRCCEDSGDDGGNADDVTVGSRVVGRGHHWSWGRIDVAIALRALRCENEGRGDTTQGQV